MTKHEIVDIIVEHTGASQASSKRAVDAIFDEIKDVIKNDEKVTIAGFGTLERKTSKARIGVNPATGEKININASHSMRFKIAKAFKEHLNS